MWKKKRKIDLKLRLDLDLKKDS